jgi:NADPH:quinone reductase-like Zn-dependent oxidoreductase
MKAIVCNKYRSFDAIELRELDTPVPKDNEVQIKVHAACVNMADVHTLNGFGRNCAESAPRQRRHSIRE